MSRNSREGTNVACKILCANGITLFKVREETVMLLGKSDIYYFSPEHPPLIEPAQRALSWALEEKIKSVRREVFWSRREDGKEKFPVLGSEFAGFGMDEDLQCKPSPSGIDYKECMRQLNH